MAKLTKAQLIENIARNTGYSKYKSKKGLKAVLEGIKNALKDGRDVSLPRVGRLITVKREQKRAIRKNLKGHTPATIVEIHKKHPKSVRLVGGKDVSKDPQPTIVHPVVKPPVPDRRASIAIIPRQRFRRF